MDPQVTRSRQRILECAVTLLRDRGPAPELTVAAAKAANVPLSVAQHFFPNHEALILAFSLLLPHQLEPRASALPDAPVTARFRSLLTATLDVLRPYRIDSPRP